VTSFWVEFMVFFGGLEADECSSNNEIRSEPLLGDVCFRLYSLVFRLYIASLFCSYAFPDLRTSCAETGY
jgi:hypothetical protein